MELVRYDAACRAVAECITIDEAAEIKNRAEALRSYARQAKNRDLEIDACEIRVRAERRAGEIILQMRDQLNMVQGRQPPGEARPTLRDLGVDKQIVVVGQRLAKLPTDRFEAAVSSWRETAHTTERLTPPLQKYRNPTRKADTQTAAARNGRSRLDAADPFDRYRNIDGRRIADWRSGELERIEQLAARMQKCAAKLRLEMPVANPDPLDTVEMIYKREALLSLLRSVWNEFSVPAGNAGLTEDAQRKRTEASHHKRGRTCKNCGTDFLMTKAPRASRPYEGQYCSRVCAGEGLTRGKGNSRH
jgi:hypothetical protein